MFENEVRHLLKGNTSFKLQPGFSERLNKAQPYIPKDLFDNISKASKNIDVKTIFPVKENNQTGDITANNNHRIIKADAGKAYRMFLNDPKNSNVSGEKPPNIESQVGFFENDVLKLLKEPQPALIKKEFFENLKNAKTNMNPDLFNNILNKISDIDTDDIDIQLELRDLQGTI